MNDKLERRSLGESLDVLRDRVSGINKEVQRLYELDEDNYQAIKTVKEALDKLGKKLNNLHRTVRFRHGKTVIGFLLVGGTFWLLAQAWTNEVKDLQKQIDELKKDKTTSEESDG